MAEETGLVFVIDGDEFPCPDIASFDMAERRVMFDLSGIVEEDFAQQVDETEAEKDARIGKLTRHPGFIEALMHIAYARGNPELKRPKVQAVIDRTNYMEAIEKWADQEEGEDDHPALEPTSKPSDPSRSDSFGSRQHYWHRFTDRFGPTGRDPKSYWSLEIGHIAHLRPCDIGDVHPSDLLGAAEMFEALYMKDD